ncbi:hypothetical protein [Marinitenerispora sediminis]|uniref:Uncharacterized protein n=1 Tax=Marinitenerispora sediminis TaxID=1931232 RepID=A0A368T690_9ACTN|nr:hypothetical protein [Marinitenerispora sediminis]RCV48312.1 hypothetical protein DEF28_23900 [Marinitenerispora sediminis]RCV49428.1 hypothetical protein DEF23_23645 [Marinitenerispora sediminis]RCV59233.1 hypothetical protein DEF24_10380 [Marinitenerispora sediminis]
MITSGPACPIAAWPVMADAAWTARHPPLSRCDMEALDLWDLVAERARPECATVPSAAGADPRCLAGLPDRLVGRKARRVRVVVRVLSGAWLAPEGVVSARAGEPDGSRHSTALVLRHPRAGRLYRVLAAGRHGALFENVDPGALLAAPCPVHAAYQDVWDGFTALRGALALAGAPAPGG